MSPLSNQYKAKWFAEGSHAAVGQRRKYTDEPYINHCLDVTTILLTMCSTYVDENMLAAAWLHDVVEDTEVTIKTITRYFGSDISGLVSDLTDVSKPSDGNRTARKRLDLLHTSEASQRAKTIKLADLISNSESIIENDPRFAKVYMKEKKELLKVLTEGDPKLYSAASDIVNNYYCNKQEED